MKRSIAIFLFLLPVLLSAQEPKNFSIPRGDPRLLSFQTGTDVAGDSIVFLVSRFAQVRDNSSIYNVIRLSDKNSWDGSEEEVFVTDSTNGTIHVYLGRDLSVLLVERSYTYALKVNDTTKFYGTILPIATVLSSQFSGYISRPELVDSMTAVSARIPDAAGGGGVTTEELSDSLAARWLALTDSLSLSTRYPAIDQLLNPLGDKTFNMATNTITWLFTNPAGGIGYKWQGAASGHLFELTQELGNPGAGAHLMHASATDPDVLIAHFSHAEAAAIALFTDGGRTVLQEVQEGTEPTVVDSTLTIGQPGNKGGIDVFGGINARGAISSPTITAILAALGDTAAYNSRLNAILSDLQTLTTAVQNGLQDTASYRNELEAILGDLQTLTSTVAAGLADTSSYTSQLNAIRTDVIAALAHIANTSNPHSVTAAQAGAVPTSRTVNTTSPLSGGGALSGDLTLSISTAGASSGDVLTYNGSAWAPAASGSSSPYDTTAWTKIDSGFVMVKETGLSPVFGFEQFHASIDSLERRGYVVFEMVGRGEYLTDWTIVADSLAYVGITGIKLERSINREDGRAGITVSHQNYGFSNNIGQPVDYAMADEGSTSGFAVMGTPYVTSTPNYHNAEFILFAQWRIFTSGTTYAGAMRQTVTVEFEQMAWSPPSAEPIKIINF